MRKWHRWIALVAGLFTLWMAVTGLGIHIIDLSRGDDDHGPAAAAVAPAGFVCPPDYTCRPRPPKGEANLGRLIKHLHSGEEFGPAGTALSIVAGLALLFFAVSGLWVYIDMWRTRRARGASPRWFWR